MSFPHLEEIVPRASDELLQVVRGPCQLILRLRADRPHGRNYGDPHIIGVFVPEILSSLHPVESECLGSDRLLICEVARNDSL